MSQPMRTSCPSRPWVSRSGRIRLTGTAWYALLLLMGMTSGTRVGSRPGYFLPAIFEASPFYSQLACGLTAEGRRMTEEAFLQEILAHPLEDGPRLVYADWVEDQGEPARAEFIRLQVEMARLSWDDPRYDALQARADGLFERHRESWCGPVALSSLSFSGSQEAGHECVHVRDFLTKAEVLPRLGLGSRPVPRNVRVLSQQDEELPAFEAEYAR